MHTAQKQQDYTISYSMLPCFYWAAFCSIISYASYYLLSIGYKNSTIGMILMGSTPVFMAGEFLFFGVLILWLLVLQPKSRKKNGYKLLCKSSPDVPKRTIKFYPYHFTVVTDTGKTKDFQYAEIMRMVETENLYVLIDQSNIGILLDKNGFKAGSIEDVKEYLTEDCQISRI